MKNTILLSTCLGLLSLPLSANFRINFDTDSSGNPIVGTGPGYTTYGASSGSFSGPGTVGANIVTGAAGHSITNVGNGAVLTTDIVDDASAHAFNPEVLTMTTTFGLIGGTADVEFAEASSGSDSYFKGWNVDGLAGVTELKITSVFSNPIHGRSNNTRDRIVGLPWGFTAGLLSAGIGLDADKFNVNYMVTDLYYLTDPNDPTTSSQTLPTSTMTSYASDGWDTESLSSSSLSFTSTDGFDGINSSGNGDTNNLVVRGLDADGDGNSADDLRSFYATQFEFTLTPANGATSFSDDTRFVFSYDGDRSSALQTIPEPTSGFLVGLASLGLITRRKR